MTVDLLDDPEALFKRRMREQRARKRKEVSFISGRLLRVSLMVLSGNGPPLFLLCNTIQLMNGQWVPLQPTSGLVIRNSNKF